MSNYKITLKVLCVLFIFWPGVFLMYANAQDAEATFNNGYDTTIDAMSVYPSQFVYDDNALHEESEKPILAFVCLDEIIKKRTELQDEMLGVQSKIRSDAEENDPHTPLTHFAFQNYTEEVHDLIMSALLLESVEDMTVSQNGDVSLDNSISNESLLMFPARITFTNTDNAVLSGANLIGTPESCDSFFEEALSDPALQERIAYNMFENFITATNLLELLNMSQTLAQVFSDFEKRFTTPPSTPPHLIE